jgi:uncharacterized protein YcbK (DUF882 family)
MLHRRVFLAGLACAVASPALARPGTLLELTNALDERLTFRWDGAADTDLANRFTHFCRDRREDVAHPMDMQLIALLAGITSRSGESRFLVLSGYRTRRTNSGLPGAATNSFHLRGQALDIRTPSLDATALHTLCAPIAYGGLGYYPASNFVHLDTGPWRRWGGGPGNGQPFEDGVDPLMAGQGTPRRSLPTLSLDIDIDTGFSFAEPPKDIFSMSF